MSITTERLTSVRYVTAILVAILAALVLARLCPARAQDRDAYQQWIHDNEPHCCNHEDCKPATATMTFTGWKVAGADNIVPFDKVIRWPFNVPYACIAGRHARCLLMDVRM